MPADRKLSHLWPPFAAVYQRILTGLQAYLDKNHAGLECRIVEGFRSAAYQHELWDQGRSTPGKIVTMRDGYHQRSNHQSSCAADVGIFKGKDYLEDPPKDVMDYYGHLCRAEKMTWGGDWTSIHDEPHCEWPEVDKAAYFAANQWQRNAGLS